MLGETPRSNTGANSKKNSTPCKKESTLQDLLKNTDNYDPWLTRQDILEGPEESGKESSIPYFFQPPKGRCRRSASPSSHAGRKKGADTKRSDRSDISAKNNTPCEKNSPLRIVREVSNPFTDDTYFNVVDATTDDGSESSSENESGIRIPDSWLLSDNESQSEFEDSLPKKVISREEKNMGDLECLGDQKAENVLSINEEVIDAE